MRINSLVETLNAKPHLVYKLSDKTRNWPNEVQAELSKYGQFTYWPHEVNTTSKTNTLREKFTKDYQEIKDTHRLPGNESTSAAPADNARNSVASTSAAADNNNSHSHSHRGGDKHTHNYNKGSYVFQVQDGATQNIKINIKDEKSAKAFAQQFRGGDSRNSGRDQQKKKDKKKKKRSDRSNRDEHSSCRPFNSPSRFSHRDHGSSPSNSLTSLSRSEFSRRDHGSSRRRHPDTPTRGRSSLSIRDGSPSSPSNSLTTLSRSGNSRRDRGSSHDSNRHRRHHSSTPTRHRSGLSNSLVAGGSDDHDDDDDDYGYNGGGFADDVDGDIPVPVPMSEEEKTDNTSGTSLDGHPFGGPNDTLSRLEAMKERQLKNKKKADEKRRSRTEMQGPTGATSSTTRGSLGHPSSSGWKYCTCSNVEWNGTICPKCEGTRGQQKTPPQRIATGGNNGDDTSINGDNDDNDDHESDKMDAIATVLKKNTPSTIAAASSVPVPTTTDTSTGADDDDKSTCGIFSDAEAGWEKMDVSKSSSSAAVLQKTNTPADAASLKMDTVAASSKNHDIPASADGNNSFVDCASTSSEENDKENVNPLVLSPKAKAKNDCGVVGGGGDLSSGSSMLSEKKRSKVLGKRQIQQFPTKHSTSRNHTATMYKKRDGQLVIAAKDDDKSQCAIGLTRRSSLQAVQRNDGLQCVKRPTRTSSLQAVQRQNESQCVKGPTRTSSLHAVQRHDGSQCVKGPTGTSASQAVQQNTRKIDDPTLNPYPRASGAMDIDGIDEKLTVNLSRPMILKIDDAAAITTTSSPGKAGKDGEGEPHALARPHAEKRKIGEISSTSSEKKKQKKSSTENAAISTTPSPHSSSTTGDDTWPCNLCSYQNKNLESSICHGCEGWNCSSCKFVNLNGTFCGVCGILSSNVGHKKNLKCKETKPSSYTRGFDRATTKAASSSPLRTPPVTHDESTIDGTEMAAAAEEESQLSPPTSPVPRDVSMIDSAWTELLDGTEIAAAAEEESQLSPPTSPVPRDVSMIDSAWTELLDGTEIAAAAEEESQLSPPTSPVPHDASMIDRAWAELVVDEHDRALN